VSGHHCGQFFLQAQRIEGSKEKTMKTTLQGLVVLMMGIALTIAMGCATKKVSYSGFLTDYPVFKPGPEGGADFVYMKEGVDFGSYNKVMMDQVVFYFKEDADYKGVHPEELQKLANAFHEAVFDALQDAYPLVGKPGPGVLRIRTAITDVVPSKPALNTVSTFLPIGLAISAAKKAATGVHTGVGQASMEAEFIDSQTNERLGAAIDTKAGEKYKVVKGMDKWGHAKDAFNFWAKRLRTWLDEVHGRQ
jgi:hypothetical protein